MENNITVLQQRIARLEGRLEKNGHSLSKRLSMYSGLVALLVSIMVGGFQIYEYTVLRYEVARKDNAIQLATWVARISELNSEIARSALLADNSKKHALAAAEGKILNAERFSIVQLIDVLLQKQSDLGSFTVYLTVSDEMLKMGNNNKAINYARSALQESETMPEKIESTRYIARVLFAPGSTQDVDAPRKTFQNAIALAKEESSYLRYPLIANSLSNLMTAEFHYGDCHRAELALQELYKEFSLANLPLLYQITLDEITFGITGSENCPNFVQAIHEASLALHRQ